MARPKGNLNLLERLLTKIIVDDLTDCWNWQGGKNNIGYGMIRDENKMRTTHRVSYEEYVGKIPYGMLVCHSCNNPACCNPQHLWLGTKKQSITVMIATGRAKIFGGPGKGMKGRKQPKTLCKHCNREISNNMYARFHGDNCKSKI